MSEIKTGGPAFPIPIGQAQIKRNEIMFNDAQFGMSLRDWFAGQALCRLAMTTTPAKDLAEWAYVIADAMIAERDKRR